MSEAYLCNVSGVVKNKINHKKNTMSEFKLNSNASYSTFYLAVSY
jgi:hypothetical protein